MTVFALAAHPGAADIGTVALLLRPVAAAIRLRWVLRTSPTCEHPVGSIE
jgi:hypothetical protein